MLTDKQILLYCGLLSLGFHLCTWGALNNNCQRWGQRIKPQISTIQVSLITGKMAVAETAPEENVQKKSRIAAVKDPPPVVVSPATRPEIVPQTEKIKDIPRPAAKTAALQKIIPQKKQEKQLQQKTTTPSLSEQVVVAVQTAELLKPFELHSVTDDNFEAQDSAVVNHHGEEEVAILAVEQTRPVAVAGNQSQGKLVGESGRGIKPAYLIHIRQMIEKHLGYPARARRLHISGKVNLHFMITANGDIDEAPILAESSYPILNKAAIRAVKQAAPFPQPQRKINVELPILFSLN
ncbi:MAG: TonB family protein [Thermodesulfobacteriota bacterium]|nr:TonB family protein [Thermodesulfobacteriota bacterium]